MALERFHSRTFNWLRSCPVWGIEVVLIGCTRKIVLDHTLLAYNIMNRHSKEGHPISWAYRAVLFPAINRSHYYAPPRRKGAALDGSFIERAS